MWKKFVGVGLVIMVSILAICTIAEAADRELSYKPVSALTELVTDPVVGDFVPVLDASSGEVKKFDATLFRSGHASGSTTLVFEASHITSAQLSFGLIRKIMEGSNDLTNEISDGTRGKQITLELVSRASSGNWIIGDDTPGNITNTGWSTITFDTAGDIATLLWLDDTTGWIVVGNSGCTIAQ